MAPRHIHDIFEDCVSRMALGQSMEDCLRIYPEHAAKLRPMLETTALLGTMNIPHAAIQQGQIAVWDRIEQDLPGRMVQRRRYQSAYRTLIAAILIIAILPTAWFTINRFDLLPNATSNITPTVQTDVPTATITEQASPTVTITPSQTPSPTPTITASPTSDLTSTAVLLATQSAMTREAAPTASPTLEEIQTLDPTRPPTATFVPGCGAPLTTEDAINRVLEVYPNAIVTSILQLVKFGGTLVWEVQISQGVELNIDVGCGYILTIEQLDGGSTPSSTGNSGAPGSAGNGNNNDQPGGNSNNNGPSGSNDNDDNSNDDDSNDNDIPDDNDNDDEPDEPDEDDEPDEPDEPDEED